MIRLTRHLLGSRRPALALVAVLAGALAGCSSSSSSSPGELHTTAQARAFIVALARGASPATWHLAGGAGAPAKRVWAERVAIADFARRIRAAKGHGYWACDLAEGATQIGVGKFNYNDRRGVRKVALQKGGTPAEVEPVIVDVERIANPDLQVESAAICG
ncbi:MAG TPA: hypothetical protein VHU13_03395 [Solirubrobacteraceae bacterium]|jgi:hypothetical protein|nr:hypothetical protein [Solirubrobacteraceae bacterium]